MEITEEQVTSLMKQLDTESQETLAKIMLQLSPNRAINLIKRWVENYEADDPIDTIIANSVAEVICKFGDTLVKASKEAHEKDLQLSGRDAFSLCINVMQEILDKMKTMQAKYVQISH